MRKPPPPIILTIAGFDPSSGAGVTADIKTIAAHDCYGVACITAMTVQSTQGVRRVNPAQPALVKETLAELSEDMVFSAVRIGMLGSGEVATVIADFLCTHQPPNVVLDPILSSTSGTHLLDQEGLAILKYNLISLAVVMTPNLHEASVISGLEVTTQHQMSLAAEKMLQMGAKAVVVTGGHLEEPGDLLRISQGSATQEYFFPAEHVQSRSTHGTGCAFSTSIACLLAHGKSLPDAIVQSQGYVRSAILSAYPIGRGFGPLNHAFRIRDDSTGR